VELWAWVEAETDEEYDILYDYGAIPLTFPGLMEDG
jgi:hypothetical protein